MPFNIQETNDFDTYSLRKKSRVKYVKGIRVQSGRTVRAAELKSTRIYINQDATDNGWFITYSYPDNIRYSDKCSEQIKFGRACCGRSHICVRLLELIIKRRGRDLKRYMFDDVRVSD
jgi:hypothetical protein